MIVVPNGQAMTTTGGHGFPLPDADGANCFHEFRDEAGRRPVATQLSGLILPQAVNFTVVRQCQAEVLTCSDANPTSHFGRRPKECRPGLEWEFAPTPDVELAVSGNRHAVRTTGCDCNPSGNPSRKR